jgi:hypothetical protein
MNLVIEVKSFKIYNGTRNINKVIRHLSAVPIASLCPSLCLRRHAEIPVESINSQKNGRATYDASRNVSSPVLTAVQLNPFLCVAVLLTRKPLSWTTRAFFI